MSNRVTLCEARLAIATVERQLDLATPGLQSATARDRVDEARAILRSAIISLDEALREPVDGTIHFTTPSAR